MLTTLLATVLLAAAPAGGPACDHATLSAQDAATLRVTRNEVFARHGRSFRSADLRAHFEAQPWYRADPDYSDARLTPADLACVERVKLWESSKGVLFRASADLDGDGDAESVFVLAQDRRLVEKAEGDFVCDPACRAALLVDDLTLPLERNWAVGGYFDVTDQPYRIVDLDAGDRRKEIWIRQHEGHDVDPGLRNRFVSLVDGRLVTAELGSGDYNSGGVELLGDGRLRLRVAHCPDHTAVYQLVHGGLKRVSEEVGPVPEYGCPACPFVDLATPGGWARQGEILRDHVGPSSDGWQALPIAATGETVVRIRISEEKDEVTWLDAVRLVADGVVIEPTACAAATLAWCADDGRPAVLERGQSIELVFELPEPAGELVLEASGYYVR